MSKQWHRTLYPYTASPTQICNASGWCSKPASTMIASGASGRISSNVPLTVRPLPSSRSEPDPARAPFDPGLVPRDLRWRILMAIALPVWDQLGPSLICRATNSVAVVSSQRCRTSAGLIMTVMRAGKIRSRIGGGFKSILDSRTLTGGYNPADVLSLQQLNCDRLEPPASTVNGHSTTLYKNTCKRPPPEGSFSDFSTLF